MAIKPDDIEGVVKAAFKKMCKKYPYVYLHMPVMNGMGSPTLDFVMCVNGLFFGVEAKRPSVKKPTPRQEETMSEMAAAGAFVFMVNSDESIAWVERFIQMVGP